MKLKTLKIKNFMGYKNEHLIDFQTSENAKVILFLGENGHGKSTIHHAARWCLYGETKKGQKIIDEKVLFNRKSAEIAKVDKSEIMSVTLDWTHENKEYSLSRECSFISPDKLMIDSSLRINKNEFVPQSSINHYVQQFFAKEISHFFFFDGEWQREFDQMAENDEEAVYIKDEIEKTLSIPTITSAIDWLEDRRDEEYKSIANLDKKKAKNEDLSIKLVEVESNLKVHEEEAQRLKIDIEKDKNRQKEIMDSIGNFESAKSEHEKMLEFRGKIKSSNELYQENLLELREELNSNVRWSSLSNKLATKYDELIQRESNNKSLANKIENLKKELEYLIQLRDNNKCPVCESIPEKEHKHYQERIIEIQNQISEIGISDNEDVAKNLQYLSDLKFNKNKMNNVRNLIKDIREIDARLVTDKLKLKELEINLSFSSNIDIKDLMSENTSLTSNITKNQGHLDTHLKKINEYKSERAALQAKISKSPDISPQKRYSFTSYAYLKNLFENTKTIYVSQIRKQVEQYASETFRQIISDKKFESLKINENFGVELQMKDGLVEPLRSTGQGKVSAISLISGLLQTALSDGFILMDTPFVSLDLGHRQQVCKWAAESNMNVSLFLHSGEFVKETDLKMLENRVGRIYRIMKLNDDESTIKIEA